MDSAHGEMSRYGRAAAGGGTIEPQSSCGVFPANQGLFLFFFTRFSFVPRLRGTLPRFIRYKNKQTTRFFCVFRLISEPSASESLICCGRLRAVQTQPA